MSTNRWVLLLAVGAAFFAGGCKLTPAGSLTYENCSFDADCVGLLDRCVTVSSPTDTRAMCTRSCVTSSDCPGTGQCLSFDGGSSFQCFQGCASSATCDFGWTCQSTTGGVSFPPVCLPGFASGPPPGVPPYDECTVGSTAECSTESQGCFGITVDGATRGICTSSCSSDASCPLDSRGLNGTCLSFDGGRAFTCFETCRTSADCASGFACKSQTADGTSFPPICVPL